MVGHFPPFSFGVLFLFPWIAVQEKNCPWCAGEGAADPCRRRRRKSAQCHQTLSREFCARSCKKRDWTQDSRHRRRGPVSWQRESLGNGTTKTRRIVLVGPGPVRSHPIGQSVWSMSNGIHTKDKKTTSREVKSKHGNESSAYRKYRFVPPFSCPQIGRRSERRFARSPSYLGWRWIVQSYTNKHGPMRRRAQRHTAHKKPNRETSPNPQGQPCINNTRTSLQQNNNKKRKNGNVHESGGTRTLHRPTPGSAARPVASYARLLFLFSFFLLL